jgi:hypothetical protein
MVHLVECVRKLILRYVPALFSDVCGKLVRVVTHKKGLFLFIVIIFGRTALFEP